MDKDEIIESLRHLQDSLERFEVEHESPTYKQSLHLTLKNTKKSLRKLQNEKDTPRKSVTSEPKDSGRDGKDQELRVQIEKNIELQNQKLRSESELRRKMEEVKHLASKNKALQEDIVLNRMNTLSMLQFFEDRAKTAENRIRDLSQELVKSQHLSKKFQQTLELSLAQTTSSGEESSGLSVAEKNQLQSLINENETLKREVANLRSENSSLIKMIKEAKDEKDVSLKLYATSEASREELVQKLQKKNKEQKQLNRTLTQTASDWLARKRELKGMKEEMRWKLINPSPVFHGDLASVQGHLPKKVYTPKRIITPRPVSSMPKS